MADNLSWKKDGDLLILTGELDSETVQPLWKQREQLTAGLEAFELSGLTRVDTAGLALLIHLVALVKKHKGSVELRGATENLQTLAKLYNLPESLLPAFSA